MKFDSKLAAGLLGLFLCLMFPVHASAAQEDPYILTVPSPERSGEMPYDYVTPFTVEHTVTRADGSRYFSGSCSPVLFRLTGEAGSDITAYCADAAAGIQPGVRYRRINLEDSTYFNDLAAGKLRAVVQKSFPACQIETVQEHANAWLRERELPEIQSLQSGEAILAAQIAIWKLSGGSGYTAHSLYSGVMDLNGYQESVVHTGELFQQPTEFTGGNIENLYTYFCNLPPEPPVSVLVSEETITRTVYTCARDVEGGYTAEVLVTVNIPDDLDALTLTASCGEQIQEQPLTVAGEYQFTFQGLPQRAAVKLEIRGIQYGADVFLFDAEGEREASQTLVGYDNSALPVSCERILTPVPSTASAVPAEPEDQVEKAINRERGVPDMAAVSTIQAVAVIVAGTACLLLFNNHNKIN